MKVEQQDSLREFEELLSAPRLFSVYQPIVCLADGEVLGWEALVRGPQESRFHRPDALFRFAEEMRLTWPLERTCRQVALRDLSGLSTDQKLFLNVNANSIDDPQFIHGETRRLLEERALLPRNVVFEITERTSIGDFSTFRRVLEHYRRQGYLVAVDDVGAGYSSLQAIAELRPDYMKLDRSLIQGIDNSTVKQASVEAFVAYAEKIGCGLVAEGIESRQELRALIGLGVQFGQGFFLGRPAVSQQMATESALAVIRRVGHLPRYRPSLTGSIELLLESVPTVAPASPVSQVVDLLKGEEAPDGAVVVDGGRPVGVVMRDRLFRRLGVPFGVALYYQRPVTAFMEPPVLVDIAASIEQAARKMVGPDRSQRQQYAVVTEDGEYLGVLSVHRLLHLLTESQLTTARHANPLTGLPGNPVIHEEMERRLKEARPFTVIYADLDYFKCFNDRYGFQDGDRVLLLLGKLVAHTVARHAGTGGFAGHIGGDDFVMIVEPALAERICLHLKRIFNRLAPQYHSDDDRRNGRMHGYDRHGLPVVLPLLSLSLAVVDVAGARYSTPEEIAQAAALVKRRAKANPEMPFVRM